MAQPQDLANLEKEYFARITAYLARRRAKLQLKLFDHLYSQPGHGEGVNQEDLLYKIYGEKYDSVEEADKLEAGCEKVGQLVGDLRKSLNTYKAENPADPVSFTLAHGHEIVVGWHLNRRATDISSDETSEPKAKNQRQAELSYGGIKHPLETSDQVKCRKLGNARKALEYVIERLPQLRMLRDVHTRPDGPYPPYKGPLIKKFQEALSVFLGGEDHQLSLIVGQSVEKAYMQGVLEAAEKERKKVTIHQLTQSGFIMNFAILYFDEGYFNENGKTKEVLWGWGHYGDENSAEQVFKSDDADLVGEFEHYYEKLKELSDKWDVRSYFAAAQGVKKYAPWQAENVKIYATWKLQRLYDLLKDADSGTTVRICTTMLRADLSVKTSVEQLLEKGVNVQITLLDHTNVHLIESRYKEREPSEMPPQKAIKHILEQLEVFEAIRLDFEKRRIKVESLGTLEVRQSDLMPFGFYAHIGDKILFGILPPNGSYNDAFMLELNADSKQGDFLQKNANSYWNTGMQPKLEDVQQAITRYKQFVEAKRDTSLSLRFPSEEND